MSATTSAGPAAAATRVPAPARSVRSLSGLRPFLAPYRGRILLAGLFLVMAALTTLVFPIALRGLIDQGLIAADPGERLLALRDHFLALFGVGAALGLFSAARFYMVSWLGERITADLRDAVYRHVIRQSPEFFESTQTGEVLSRLTTDTTLVQTVVGSSLSMGLRNTVMGVGAMAMLIATNPYVMAQVLGMLVLVVLPSIYFGRRVRKLSRASQDRVADSSAIAAEVLNAIPVVQSYTQEAREAERFHRSTQSAFATAVNRTRMRSFLVGFIITATFGLIGSSSLPSVIRQSTWPVWSPPIPRLTAFSGAKCSAHIFFPAPSQPCVIESPMKTRLTLPFLTRAFMASWRFIQPPLRGTGLIAECCFFSSAETPVDNPARRTPVSTINIDRCSMVGIPE